MICVLQLMPVAMQVAEAYLYQSQLIAAKEKFDLARSMGDTAGAQQYGAEVAALELK